MRRCLVLALALPAFVLGCSRAAPEPEPVRAVRTLTVGEGAEGSSVDAEVVASDRIHGVLGQSSTRKPTFIRTWK